MSLLRYGFKSQIQVRGQLLSVEASEPTLGVWRCELCHMGFRSPQAVASHKKHMHPGVAAHVQKEPNLAAASYGPTPSGPPVSLAPGGLAAPVTTQKWRRRCQGRPRCGW